MTKMRLINRVSPALFGLVLLVPAARPVAVPAWPHRASLTSMSGRPASLHAYTLGGVFIVPVDDHGSYAPSSSRPYQLTERDTVRASTPAEFYLDLEKGPVVFVADRDSVQLVVGFNPYGSINKVEANGRRFTVRLVDGAFVIDAKP